ncbi:MAG TPA: alpha/beta hydrolase [Pyrinomonadaceae bacterium]|nr:alpha/beta hydrolase [Pyrinomonadaceae bacterium]
MTSRRKLIKRVIKAFLPILLVVLVAIAAVTVWIVNGITKPPRAAYLVTPQTFSRVTGPMLKATEVTWTNHDGTHARGWLVRGAEGSPSVVLLHRYGADRSWLLNLAVKLNETTNFTVLWPDLRGHGENPPVNRTYIGAVDGDDATAAIDYLHTLKTASGKPQVAGVVGIYGVELGAYAALDAAKRYPEIRALALDSAPASPDDLVRAATSVRAGMNNAFLQRLASWGLKIYSFGKYQSTPSCELARSLKNVRVLLLAGGEGDSWRTSTLELGKCFNGSVEVKKDLPVTGVSLPSATGEQEEAYDRPVIEFFDKALR